MHERDPKIIHRDIKPSNILAKYTENSAQIKLCDFGLSKFIKSESQSNSSNVGTHNYRAPEVKNGRKYDTKADIYSLGVTAKE